MPLQRPPARSDLVSRLPFILFTRRFFSTGAPLTRDGKGNAANPRGAGWQFGQK